MIEHYLEYIFWGLLGAIAHIVTLRVWDEKEYIVRELILSAILALAIAGFNLPNRITTFGLAYAGVDTIEAVLRRLTRSVPQPAGERDEAPSSR